MNASEHHVGTAVARHFPNFIAAQRIGRVDPDTDNIAGLNASGIHSSQRFIDKRGIAEGFGSCRRKHVQPTRRDYRGPERGFAGINEMNAHTISPFLRRSRHRPAVDIIPRQRSETIRSPTCNPDLKLQKAQKLLRANATMS